MSSLVHAAPAANADGPPEELNDVDLFSRSPTRPPSYMQLHSFSGFSRNGVSPMSEPTSTPDPNSHTRLIIIGPVANVVNQPKELNALNKQHNTVSEEILRVLKTRKGHGAPYIGMYTSPPMDQAYSGVRHMIRFTDNMVIIARNLYLDLCKNCKRIDEVHVVACESGVYLALKIIELIDRFGDSLTGSLSKFDEIWIKLPCGEPIDLPTQVGFKISVVCRTITLIEPSLPALSFLSSWLAYPRIYNHLNLVAPKSEKRLVLVLHTNHVATTHRGVQIAGAEHFDVDGVAALVERLKNFVCP